jgi:hypothetical protein
MDATAMGFLKRDLRSLPTLLRFGINAMAASILPAAGKMEVHDGNRGKAAPL